MMDDIVRTIRLKNPEEVSVEELNAFRLEIDEALCRVNELQRMHRELTGRDYVPDIRL